MLVVFGDQLLVTLSVTERRRCVGDHSLIDRPAEIGNSLWRVCPSAWRAFERVRWLVSAGTASQIEEEATLAAGRAKLINDARRDNA